MYKYDCVPTYSWYFCHCTSSPLSLHNRKLSLHILCITAQYFMPFFVRYVGRRCSRRAAACLTSSYTPIASTANIHCYMLLIAGLCISASSSSSLSVCVKIINWLDIIIIVDYTLILFIKSSFEIVLRNNRHNIGPYRYKIPCIDNSINEIKLTQVIFRVTLSLTLP